MSSILNISNLQTFSFSHSISTTPNFNFIFPKLIQLSLKQTTIPNFNSIIRMGGGPRTFPGGVSKWQWKRMQAKKAKQLLKARLCRERQIYEMRKRAELKSAVAELEKPWEVVERAPTLFSVKADEQLKVLADRFQKAGGFDMWSDHDGPQLFDDAVDTVDQFPSSRFFPKGVVHSLKPYQKVSDLDGDDDSDGLSVMSLDSGTENGRTITGTKNGSRRSSIRRLKSGSKSDDEFEGKQLSLTDDDDGLTMIGLDSGTENAKKNTLNENGSRRNSMRLKSGSSTYGEVKGKQLSSSSRESMSKGLKQGNAGAMESMSLEGGKSMVRNEIRKKGSRQISGSLDSKESNGNSEPLISSRRNYYHLRKGGDSSVKKKDYNSKVFDMNLQHDGTYEL